MKTKTLFAAVITASLYPSVANAHGVSTIYSPYVHAGEAAVEVKGSYKINEEDSNEDSFASEMTVGYGLTHFWQMEAGAELESNDEDDTRFTALVWENKFQLAPEGALFLDPGIKIEYAKSVTGEADQILARLLLARHMGKFSNLSNINFGRELGESSSDDWEYGFSYGLSYNHSETFSYGLEWHSDFGDFEGDYSEQGHRAGPAVYGQLAEGMPFEAGVLFGVSEHAPDAELKAVVEYEF